MLTEFLLHWNIGFLIFCALLNVITLCAHLNAWTEHYHRRDGEKVGYFVFFFLLVSNLFYLVFAKVPLGL